MATSNSCGLGQSLLLAYYLIDQECEHFERVQSPSGSCRAISKGILSKMPNISTVSAEQEALVLRVSDGTQRGNIQQRCKQACGIAH